MFPLLQSRCYGHGDRQMLYNAARGNIDFIQRLTLDKKLEVHSGCVNSICWSDKGTSILSGSDDQHLAITDPFSGKVVHKIRSGHKANIFSAKFLPSCNDMRTVSCSGDGKIYYTNIERDDTYGTYMFDCHFGTTYEVIVIPNEASTFLSCGEDGTVRFFDLRAKTSCNKPSCKDDILISCRSALTAITANPLFPWQLGIGCSDSSVRIYDRRMLGTRATGNYAGRGIKGLMSTFTPPNLKKESYRVTSLNFSPDGEDVLVSYSSEYIYLFGTNEPEDCKQLSKELPKTEKSTNLSESSSLSTQEASTSQQNEETVSRAPPVKRLRLRGDWSDTGPGARPERERQTNNTAAGERNNEAQPAGAPSAVPLGGNRAALLNRMSDVLTRWLRQSNENHEQGEGNSQEQVQDEGRGRSPALSGENSNSMNEEAQSNLAGNTDSLSSENVQIESGSNTQAQTDIEDGSQCGENTGASSTVLVASNSNDCVETTIVHSGEETKDSLETTSHSDEVLLLSRRSPSQEIAFGQRSDPESLDSKSDESQLSFVQKIESMNVDDNDSTDPEEQTTKSRSGVETSDDYKHQDSGKELYNPLQPTSYPGLSGAEVNDQNKEDNNDVHEPMHSAINQSVSMDGAIDKSVSSKDSECVLQKSAESESHSVDKVTDKQCNTTNVNDTCPSDEDPPYMVETGRYRETVSAAVNTLRAQNVKPVVSLHYSSEGTSASTIKVGFTRFQSLEEEIDQQHPSVSSELADVNPQSEMVSDSLGEVSYSNDSVIDKRDSGNTGNGIGGLESHNGISDLKSVSETGRDSLEQSNNGSANISSVSDSDGIVNNDIKCGTSALETEICDNRGAFKPFSVQTADNEQQLLLNEDSEQSSESKLEHNSDMPSCSYRDKASHSEEFTSSSDTVVDSTSRDSDTSRKLSDQQSAVPDETKTSPEQSTSVSRPVADVSSSNETGARPRQRRVGHSGPPTGNFQLNDDTRAGGGDSSSEEDEQAAPTRRRTDFERTTAALKLQAFHRLRQEAKEKKEMESKNIFMPKVKQVYKGHRNARTMIKESNFWGDRFVLSGSDCGHVFIWDRYTAEVVMLLEADKHVVNCIQPHPYETTLATSGIDYDVKLWAPLLPKSCYDMERAAEVMHRNAIMLEETRDTITVPAIFMLRVLASINNVQSGRRGAAAGRQQEGQNEEEHEQHSDTE